MAVVVLRASEWSRSYPRHHAPIPFTMGNRVFSHQRNDDFTAGFISIDRFAKGAAPIRLPFDGVRARYPGIAMFAGSYVDLSRSATWFSHSLLGLQALLRLTVHVEGTPPVFVNGMIAGTRCRAQMAAVFSAGRSTEIKFASVSLW